MRHREERRQKLEKEERDIYNREHHLKEREMLFEKRIKKLKEKNKELKEVLDIFN